MTRAKTPPKRSIRMQTEKPRARMDVYKEDWVESLVFKRAVKAEAIKRGLPFEEVETDEEEDISNTDNRTLSDFQRTGSNFNP